ncbi:MAG TPA: SRPBCC domain-containing protein [Phycisphaerae bacterium]|nr:SRPBCC domain-containing protein [Phycisphaerae bacterium]
MTIAAEPTRSIQTLFVQKETLIAAPPDVVFETLLTPLGRMAEMNLKIEPWPGGRWYRDLGNNTGHLWGHVQVIKPPKLLEIVGPMFMSYAVASHIQYRITEEGKNSRLSLTHQAIGLLSEEHIKGVNTGWEEILSAIQAAAEAKPRK